MLHVLANVVQYILYPIAHRTFFGPRRSVGYCPSYGDDLIKGNCSFEQTPHMELFGVIRTNNPRSPIERQRNLVILPPSLQACTRMFLELKTGDNGSFIIE
jgi:hypothetical protein